MRALAATCLSMPFLVTDLVIYGDTSVLSPSRRAPCAPYSHLIVTSFTSLLVHSTTLPLAAALSRPRTHLPSTDTHTYTLDRTPHTHTYFPSRLVSPQPALPLLPSADAPQLAVDPAHMARCQPAVGLRSCQYINFYPLPPLQA
jgi:hypothetical protein